MGNVEHVAGAQIAPDGSRRSLSGIGRSEEIANPGHGLVALKDEGQHGTGGHETDDFREEWLVRQVRVVLVKKGGGQSEHFGGNQLESGLLKSAKHLASEVLFHAIRFAEDEGTFHLWPGVVTHLVLPVKDRSKEALVIGHWSLVRGDRR